MLSLRHGRNPRQRRSVETVERVLAAAASEYAERGYAHTTTNHIAKRAGVHVPSVYQYFENKDALLAELWDRHVGQLISLLAEMLKDRDARPIEQTARGYVHAVLEMHFASPRLLAELYAEAPKISGVLNIREEAEELLVPYLSHYASELRPTNLPIAAFILASAVEGVARQAAVDPHWDRQVLSDELTELVTSYLGVPS